MKAMKYWLFLFVLLTASLLKAQELQKVVTIGKELHSPDWYRTQAKLWEAETLKDPKNEASWENYYRSIRILSLMSDDEESRTFPESAMNQLLKDIERCIPETFTYNLINYSYGKQDPECMQKAYNMRPDDVAHFSDYLAYMILNNRIPEVELICKKWYNSGEYSPALLNYNYNEFVGMDKNSIVFTNGDTHCYSKYILQCGKGLFQDCKVVVISFLPVETYRNALTEALGISPFIINDEVRQKYKTGTELIIAIMQYITDNVKRSVYFSWGHEDLIMKAFEKNLYSEGLVLKYSKKPYNNLIVRQRNYEQIYLLDYLSQAFYKDDYETVTNYLNLSYVYGFKSLLNIYKGGKDLSQYNRLYGLLKQIIARSDPARQKQFTEYLERKE